MAKPINILVKDAIHYFTLNPGSPQRKSSNATKLQGSWQRTLYTNHRQLQPRLIYYNELSRHGALLFF